MSNEAERNYDAHSVILELQAAPTEVDRIKEVEPIVDEFDQYLVARGAGLITPEKRIVLSFMMWLATQRELPAPLRVEGEAA